MAPTKKVKKVINQEELRRLMRAKQRQTTDKKRIESPFAKYNSLGHLSCVLCKVQVKNELLWSAHVLGKPHKEKVSELKESRQTPQSQSVKRKAPDSREDVNGKKAKPTLGAGQSVSGVPTDFFAKPAEKEPGPPPQKTSAGLSLLAGVYSENDDDEDEEEEGGGTASASTGIPADFFDGSIPSVPTVSHSGSVRKADEQEKPAEEKKKEMAETLPEGFFDDPVRDAKVRKVDAPKDHLDKEWDEFQKEMRLVNTKSEAIVAEDDEEGRFERQIDEIDEQIECYRRVELLRDKRDVVKSKPLLTKSQGYMDSDVNMGDEEEDDDEELLDVLSRDWRAKGALE